MAEMTAPVAIGTSTTTKTAISGNGSGNNGKNSNDDVGHGGSFGQTIAPLILTAGPPHHG
jgi:hypothetical protein